MPNALPCLSNKSFFFIIFYINKIEPLDLRISQDHYRILHVLSTHYRSSEPDIEHVYIQLPSVPWLAKSVNLIHLQLRIQESRFFRRVMGAIAFYPQSLLSFNKQLKLGKPIFSPRGINLAVTLFLSLNYVDFSAEKFNNLLRLFCISTLIHCIWRHRCCESLVVDLSMCSLCCHQYMFQLLSRSCRSDDINLDLMQILTHLVLSLC